jgi:hypothetical protein
MGEELEVIKSVEDTYAENNERLQFEAISNLLDQTQSLRHSQLQAALANLQGPPHLN